LSCDANILARADCVILAGAAIDYRLGYLQQHTRVLRLDRGWRRLMEALQQQPLFDDWLREARTIRSSFVARVRSSAESQRVAPRMHAVDIIDAIETAVPLDATLIIDGGSIGQWAHHLLTERRYPGHWLTCGRSGVVGYGLGAAMAARLASPTRPVVLLSGDGAFTFTLGELECAVRQKLPFVVIVADDQKWGITHAGHIKQYGEGIATQLGPIRFASLAASLGARGIQVERAEDISAALSQALAWREVTVIHVPIVGGNPQQ
jgi:acetolactate synthase-1/2/3 large subunit